MTEDEAKTKWCPFVRAVTGAIYDDGRSNHATCQPAINRIVDDTKWAFPKGVACIGSACMAWRWKGKAAFEGQPIERYGRCGLAGEEQFT